MLLFALMNNITPRTMNNGKVLGITCEMVNPRITKTSEQLTVRVGDQPERAPWVLTPSAVC